MTRSSYNRRTTSTTRLATAGVLAFVLLALPAPMAAGGGAPGCLPGTEVSFSPTGAIQTFDVPAGATEVLIDITGAAGGDVIAGKDQVAGYDGELGPVDYAGGLGARVAATVPVAGPLALSVVVGERGETPPLPNPDLVGLGSGGAGGGGGSFVFAGSVVYAAAGGGGGAGITDDGHDAELGENGGAGDPPFGGAGGVGGAGGSSSTSKGANSGAGGGFNSAGEDGPGPDSGFGGHRISSPGDAAGGAGSDGSGDGGFGGGGGGSAVGGGGGGGYSGGGGAYGEGADGGGGGGSFVALSGSTIALELAAAPADGIVNICVTAQGGDEPSVLEVPSLSSLGLLALGGLLALIAVALLRRRRHA